MTTRRELRKRWQRELSLAGWIKPSWPGMRLPATYPIDDYALLPTDNYQPKTHNAVVITQHAPRPGVDPQVLLLETAVAARETKPKTKHLKPDGRWLNAPVEPAPPTTPKVYPVDWTRFETTTEHDVFHGFDVFKCKTCGTCIRGSDLDARPWAQTCPHRYHP